MPVFSKVLRCLLWGVLAIYALVAITFLGLRHWVLPRIDQWRPQIERHVSDALGARVQIGAIAADWSGLNPRLHLSAVRLYEEGQADPALSLPKVDTVIGWRSLVRLSPRLLLLRIEGAELAVRRDADGRIWVAGHSFDPAEGSDGPSPALRWLLAQRQIGLYRSTLRWQDEQRQAPELVLSDLDLLVRNGALSHRFGMRARVPGELASGFSMRGEFNRHLFARNGANPFNWDGQLYFQLDDAEPSAWHPWLPVPAGTQGRLAARAWVRLSQGHMQDLTVDTVLRGLHWQAPEDLGTVVAQTARARLQGVPGDLLQFDDLPMAPSKEAAGLSLDAQAQGLRLALPGVFETPHLDFDLVSVDASLLRRPGQPRMVELRQLRAVNRDMDARLQGSWRDEGRDPAGTVDLRGSLARAAMPAIHRYLPLSVGVDARRWLAHGLQAGEVRDAAVTVRGELADFPYGAPGTTGEFRIAGAYRDAVVDYAPAEGRRKGWPRLEKLHGDFSIDKVSLAVDTVDGEVPTGHGHVVSLGAVQAAIPNLEHNAELSVTGVSEGPAPAYLALAANSPLGGLLDNLLAEAEATGTWHVPLTLHVPLTNVDDAKVEGQIGFTGGSFRLMPEIPTLGQVQGSLDFTERAVKARDIRANFLGGPARLSGGLGPGQSLEFAGTLTAAGLRELSRAPAMARLSGRAAYAGRLSYAKNADLDVSVRSDLTGMAIDMPAPVGKSAAAALPLTLQWSPATDSGPAGRRWLSGGLGQDINLIFERDPAGQAGGPYFARGALGVGRPATMPAQGMSVAGTFDRLDLDGWDDVAEAFADKPAPAAAQKRRGHERRGEPALADRTEERAAAASGSAPRGARAADPGLLPPLNQISLAARQLVAGGHTLDALTVYAQRPAPAQWRVSLEARQAAGTLEWTEASGAVAGKVAARFSRLAVGGADGLGKEDEGAANPESDAEDSGLSDIPAIDLQAKQFVLYGRDVGSLELMGTNLERGSRWSLDKLQIANDAATLNATGNWRLKGPDRGLTVDAKANFGDLGKFLSRIGEDGAISAGSGTVDGTITWRNLPFKHDIADIEGSVTVSLDKGRFLHLNSRTARLLELLSLQSLQRLAKLDLNPTGVLREGFPFDTVRGTMKVSNGVASTEGYKINGPVAAVVLGGTADLVAESWDMRAVVIPNLDASGAAVVTALAVNPLLGLGAFVTQWLLKQPLAEAMTAEYKVTGSWDDPKIEAVESRAPRATTPARQREAWVEP